MMTCAIQVPFQAIFAYAWDLLLPSGKNNDIALEIAKQETERERERSKQSEQHTRQMELMAECAQQSHVITQKALDILNYAVENGITLANDDYRLGRDEIRAIRNETESQLEREEIVKANREELSKIEPEKERRLAGQMRRSVPDLALPLRSSAESLQIGSADQISKFAQLTDFSVTRITRESEDDETVLIRGKIKMYDVENGYGKFRYDVLKRPIVFRITPSRRVTLNAKILDAMKKKDVLVNGYFIRDAYKNPTAFVIEDVLEDEALDMNLR